jgi:hypothetical protein
MVGAGVANPSFVPYPAAHDPMMRKPAAMPWPVLRRACNYCRDSATADVWATLGALAFSGRADEKQRTVSDGSA